MFWNGDLHGRWEKCNEITGPYNLQEKGQKKIARDDGSDTKKDTKKVFKPGLLFV